MKKLTLSVAVILIIIAAKSQECFSYFPSKVGAVLVYTNYDEKEKETSVTTNKIVRSFNSGDTSYLEFYSEVRDVKTDSVMKNTYYVGCIDGVVLLSFDNFNSSKDINIKVEVSGDKFDLPSDLEVGKTLKDANYTIIFKMNGNIILKNDVKITNRKVDARENVTTPAGTFDCYVISYQNDVKMGFLKTKVYTKQWYSKKYGMVKFENYNEKNKLTGKQVLTKIENF